MSLPHRFSESAFRKYEPYITEIAQRFPKPVTLSPSKMGLASETVRGRLRDAITSAINNRWPHSTVNYAMLLNADVSGLVVSLRPDGNVVVGTKDTIKEKKIESLDSIIESDEIFDATSIVLTAQLDFLAHLAANKQLKNKCRVRLVKHYAETLQNTYDIILEPTNEPNEYLLS